MPHNVNYESIQNVKKFDSFARKQKLLTFLRKQAGAPLDGSADDAPVTLPLPTLIEFINDLTDVTFIDAENHGMEKAALLMVADILKPTEEFTRYARASVFTMNAKRPEPEQV
jgi:hypothetical protein